MAEDTKNIKKIRDACLANAEALLVVAEREIDNNVGHICFHLALLALEEIGKSLLTTISFTVSLGGKETGGLEGAMDDHVKKIFWAIWGGMLRGDKFTKQQIDQSRGLATSLHDRRIFSLYTDPNEPLAPDTRVSKEEAERLIKFTRLRLEIEKSNGLTDKFEDKDIENLTWFFKSTEDIDKRKSIFSPPSLKKLEELKNGKDWINWLRETFQKNEEEMRKLAEQEIRRPKPSETEAFKPKYKMRVKIQSSSHSVRDNAFTKWNQGVRDIKIYKATKKQMSSFAKSELLIDFLFPKAIQIHMLWDHGFFMAKTLVSALNIATKGLFWWNVPKDIEKFYEEITDLDADKGENIKIGIVTEKRLAIAWGDMVLNEQEMGNVSMIFAFLIRESKKLENFMKPYALALTVFTKTDIHLRMEVNAFDEFFKAFKEALFIFGDWDKKSDLIPVIKKQFSKLEDHTELERIIRLGIDLDPQKWMTTNITLTEVAAMKLYSDVYIQMKANEYFSKLKDEPDPKEEGIA